jgi:gluconolactonase
MREVTSGLLFPEGPVALPDDRVALVEIARRTVTLVAADGTKTVLAEPGGGPNGLAMGPGGAFFVTNNGGFDFHCDADGIRPTVQASDYSGGRLERVDAATGAVAVLYRETGSGFELRGPNDLVVDREGGIWFTDLGKRRAREMDYGGVYYAAADGSAIREAAYPFLTANGIGLSPDEMVLYVAETEGGRLWAFDLEAPGRIKKQPWPSPHGGRLVYTAGNSYERFDSLAVEASGNICVATLINGGISVISPAGELVDFVTMPDRYTTNICFGGKDLKTAFVTLSQSGRLVAMDWPRAGLPLNFLNI